MSTDQLVRLSGVSRAYPGVQALDAVDFDVHVGEVVGLVGKNGAGKSTLIRILAGLEAPDRGEVVVDGQPVQRFGPRQARSAGFHFVFQELEEFPELTVAENVLLGSRFPRAARLLLSRRQVDRAAATHLARIGCEIAPRRQMDTLSAVERRLVMIARALAGSMRLLVLDEPTASLTVGEVARVLQVCRQLRASGAAVVYVSHRLEEVLDIADRLVVMRDGHVVDDRPRGGVQMDDLVSSIAGRDLRRSAQRSARASQPAGSPRLAVRHLSDGRRFESVSFDVRDGEVVGLAGLVGAGRTEILETIVGARGAVAGTVELDGHPARFRSVDRSLAAGVVLLPEDRRRQGLVADFGVRENATLSGLRRFRLLRPLLIVSRRRERAALQPLVAKLGMKIRDLEQPVRTLSGGTQQKVVTARALLSASSVIIMDEPTVGVDVEAKEEIYDLVTMLRNDGKALILVSSEFGELVRLCDRVVVIAQGRPVGELVGDEIEEDEITRLCYLGRRAPEAPSEPAAGAGGSPDATDEPGRAGA